MRPSPTLHFLTFRGYMAVLALSVCLGALAVAGKARADPMQAGSITVFGGAMLAVECSHYAKAGYSDLHADKVCTESLQTETLSSRDLAATLVNRGVMRMRRIAFAEANQDFNMAVRIKPNLAEAYVNRGAVAIALHRASDGLADMNRALALGVGEPEKAYFNRALAYEALDNLKAAYFDYLKAQELAPEWAPPKEQLTRFTVTRR